LPNASKIRRFSRENFSDCVSEGVRAGDHRRAARDLRTISENDTGRG
jgi:hypothetical protein